MRPQNPRNIGAWNFIMMDLTGNEIAVPPGGSTSTLDELQSFVLQYMEVFDNATEGEYTKKQRELAEKNNLSFEDYVRSLIEHQMCVRNKGSLPCWNDGFGDALHGMSAKIDTIVKALPTPLQVVIQRSIEKITPSQSKTLAGCSSCGGTQVFNPQQNNLGRAGEVNRIVNKLW